MKYPDASDEPLDQIEELECGAWNDVVTKRFKTVFNELYELKSQRLQYSTKHQQAANVANYFSTLIHLGVPSDWAHELTVHYQDAMMGVGAKCGTDK